MYVVYKFEIVFIVILNFNMYKVQVDTVGFQIFLEKLMVRA
jgi:hypothetical protein